MKRSTLNLGLAVVVAALAATVYFTRDHGKEDEHPPLITVAPETITRIVLEVANHAPVTLAKAGDGWQIETPVRARADRFEIAGLLNIASQKAYRQLPLAEVDLAELKLEPPQYTLHFNDQTLAFGDVDPLEFRRYVRIGTQVALTDDPPATAVDADYSNLVAKELLPAAAGIRSIEVPGLRVARDAGDQNWQATPAGADAASAARFVEAWRGARAMWLTPMPADGGQGAPIIITLDDERIELRLVAREPQLLLDRPDIKVRYAVSKAEADTLLQLAAPARPSSQGS